MDERAERRERLGYRTQKWTYDPWQTMNYDENLYDNALLDAAPKWEQGRRKRRKIDNRLWLPGVMAWAN